MSGASVGVARRRAIRAFLGLAALGVAGCAGDDAPPPCPEVQVLADTARVVDFAGSGRDLTDKRFEASIANTSLTCEIRETDRGPEVVAELQVLFELEKGPASRDDRLGLRYFVAVARDGDTVLNRRAFDLRAQLSGSQTRGRVVETLAPTIPLAPRENPRSYRIYVGFVLSQDQLDYNRRNPL